jgi:transposase InsO family protein
MITNKNRIASADAKMAFWRKGFPCSFWQAYLRLALHPKWPSARRDCVWKKRIVRLMRDQEREVIQKRAFRPKTTQSRHDQSMAPNRSQALPEPPQTPNEVWCADTTYRPSQQEGWLYLAGELDLCSECLVGWKLGTSLAAPLVMAAFERAANNWSVER